MSTIIANSLLALPPELPEAICRILSRRELKLLRSICKYLEQIATPWLFGGWTLWPHRDHLKILANVAQYEGLRLRLGTLRFDNRFLGVVEEFVDDLRFDTFTDPEEKQTRLEVVKRSDDITKGDFAGEDLMEIAIITTSFQECFRRLPNLPIGHPCNHTSLY